LEDIVALHGATNIAAVIVEPVAGSAGVLPPPQGYLTKLRAICDKHDILLIFDEVITGFGRLGTPFAAEFFGVKPDIMATAKGLTGAVIPAGAVLAQNEIYDSIMNAAPANTIEFFHGYTYSAHPTACAAGIAMLKHLTEDGLYEQGRALIPHFEDAIHSSFDDDEYVVDVRNVGLMGAVQLRTPDGHQPGAFAAAVMNHAWQHEDLYIRVAGETIAFSPAFIASEDQLGEIFEGTKRSIHAAAKTMGI
jgi:beta-alanine--pyruvate transaminase